MYFQQTSERHKPGGEDEREVDLDAKSVLRQRLNDQTMTVTMTNRPTDHVDMMMILYYLKAGFLTMYNEII